MYSTYRLRAEDLSSNLINAIKKTYQNKEIEIIVQEIQDETDYLLGSPANREHLLTAIANVNSHKNLVQMSLEEL